MEIENYLTLTDKKKVSSLPNYIKIFEKSFDKIDQLFIFTDFDFLNNLLMNWTKKCFDSKIILVQEGMGGYYEQSIFVKSFVRHYASFLLFKFLRGQPLKYFSIAWGRNILVDEVLADFPSKILLKKNARATSYFVSATITESLNTLFNFDPSYYRAGKFIIYLPLSSTRFLKNFSQVELSYIKKINQYCRLQKLKLIIKPKSGQNYEQFINLEKDGIILLKDKIPTELLLLNIEDSMVISAFSSSGLTRIKNHVILWIAPVLGINEIKITPPSDHIKLVYTESDIFKEFNRFFLNAH